MYFYEKDAVLYDREPIDSRDHKPMDLGFALTTSKRGRLLTEQFYNPAHSGRVLQHTTEPVHASSGDDEE